MSATKGTGGIEEAEVGEDDAKDRVAQSLCVATCIKLMAVTMVMPTRAPMVLAIKKGDAAATAKAMGLMSTFAALVELLVNPVLGKLSDQYGRKPFMTCAPLFSAFMHLIVSALPTSLTAQFLDRIISGSMIFSFLAPAQAGMADLFPNQPTKLAVWSATSGMLLGLGATLGPVIGSKLGGARSFLFSSLGFLATSLWVSTRVKETLSPDLRRPFSVRDINPIACLKLFREPTLAKLSLTSALQSFGDYANIYDINNLFMIKTLGYDQKQLGTFATVVGITQIAGGKATAAIISQLKSMSLPALKLATLFANLSWALGMAIMGSARTQSQAFIALSLWTFGNQRSNSVAVYMQKYGAEASMGRAEIVAATGNLLAYVKVLVPLLYSNLFAWATSQGRDVPGLPYFVISFLTLLSHGTFCLAAPQD